MIFARDSHLPCYWTVALSTLVALLLNIASAAAEPTDAESEPLRWRGLQGGWYVSDPANWAEHESPEMVKSRPADFRSRALVVVDRDQRFHGGVRMDSYRLDIAWYLRHHTLTLAGDVNIGAGRSSGFMSEGTWRLGEPGHAAHVRFYAGGGEGNTFHLTNTAVLHTDQVAELSVADASGNTRAKGTFDLSRASLVEDAFRAETLRVGRYRGRTPNRGGEGVLRLPASTRTIAVDQLLLGVNERKVGDGDPSIARGVLDMGGGEAVALIVRDTADWAVGDHASAALSGLPSHLELAIGSPDAPAAWRIAVNDRLDESKGTTAFEWTAPAGTVRAHLAELIVGRNTGSAGTASGTLDLSAMTPATFDAGKTIIGAGIAAMGRLELPAGKASFNRLTVGDNHQGADGTVVLHGTDLTISETVSIGAAGTVIAHVSDTGRIDVTNDNPSAFQIAPGGELRLAVTTSGDRVTGGRWLLRCAGDRTDQIAAMLDDGRVMADGVDPERVSVRHVDGQTVLAID
ncbi:MAG: hypothetical protein ACOC9P_00950 [bacterium]